MARRRLFFFGTLMDEAVRGLVIGREGTVSPARVDGFARVAVAGRDYPTLVRRPASRVAGVLTAPLDAEAIRRLCRYEGPEYRLRPIRVRSDEEGPLAALVFLCRPKIAAGRRPWRLDDWQRRHRRTALLRIRVSRI